MKKFQRPSKVWILILTLIGGYFLFVRKDKKMAAHEPSAQIDMPASGVAVIQSQPATAETVATQERRRRNYNTLIASGVKPIPAETKGKYLRVRIQAKTEAQWCKPGDFDLIKALAKNPADKFIALSLEPLGKGPSPKAEKLSISEIASGRVISFNLPKKDGAYGLYLCTDQNGTGRCAQKAAIDSKIWGAKKNELEKLGADKIFYFQLLYVKDGALNIIPSGKWGPDNLRQLQQHLKAWMGEDLDALEVMDSLISQLKPLPARLKNKKIELPLPYNDPRCASR